MYKKILTHSILLGITSLSAQTITMNFPAFAGKTYDFVIFQGSNAEKVVQDTIPKNGNFKLTIPAKFAPYNGMCRWLLTNSEQGGGIDMAIPGYDFKVSCLSDKPDESNIKYLGFDAVNELNRLNREQQTIIDKFEAMSRAMKLYNAMHPLYSSFVKERDVQVSAYERFHLELKKNTNYNARFLPIVNLVTGNTTKLTDDSELKAKYVNEYIVHDLDYDDLYTSGHWAGIIQSWVQMHAQLYNDKDKFVKDFSVIHNKIVDPKKYTDWVGKITYYLTQYTKDDFIEAIAPLVLNSNRITSYEGKTMQVYVKAMIGNEAPDLVITEHVGKLEDHNHKQSILKSRDFAQGTMNKTLLVFYQSGCGPCEELLQQLPGKYDALIKQGIDIIAISADESKNVFENTSRSFPWKRTYCDFDGKSGINFKNYAAAGTPMMYLITKDGKIEKKISTIMDVLK